MKCRSAHNGGAKAAPDPQPLEKRASLMNADDALPDELAAAVASESRSTAALHAVRGVLGRWGAAADRGLSRGHRGHRSGGSSGRVARARAAGGALPPTSRRIVPGGGLSRSLSGLDVRLADGRRFGADGARADRAVDERVDAVSHSSAACPGRPRNRVCGLRSRSSIAESPSRRFAANVPR